MIQKFCIYSIKVSIKCLSANSFSYLEIWDYQVRDFFHKKSPKFGSPQFQVPNLEPLLQALITHICNIREIFFSQKRLIYKNLMEKLSSHVPDRTWQKGKNLDVAMNNISPNFAVSGLPDHCPIFYFPLSSALHPYSVTGVTS